jgi:hypothetical protein
MIKCQCCQCHVLCCGYTFAKPSAYYRSRRLPLPICMFFRCSSVQVTRELSYAVFSDSSFMAGIRQKEKYYSQREMLSKEVIIQKQVKVLKFYLCKNLF